jgi:PleD family two-component response regulator
MHFLVVDDSSVDRHALVGLLSSLGHTADQCENPMMAVQQIEVNTYDSIFLDVVMPDLDGYKLLRAVRLNPKTTGQYIVIFSNKKTVLEVDYGIKRAGADDYLTKPVTREQLDQILERVPA